MNEQEIREGLKTGRQHPFPLLQHLAREGDQEGARLVAKIGPEYLSGQDRLRLRGLVRELTPEVSEAEEAQRARRSESKRQERTTTLADALAAKNAATRERRKGFRPPTGGGWNLPLDAKGE